MSKTELQGGNEKSKEKIAVLLVNLGTPDQPTPQAVRRYLAEFLWDKRVIEGGGLRRALWWLVLHGIILRTRPCRVARLYASIWEQDSPMRRILNQQVAALQLALQERYPERAPDVFSAMTYGNPGLSRRLRELHRDGYRRVLIMPLYPQYSATSTAPIYDIVARFQLATRDLLDVRILKSYHDHPAYIAALAETVREAWAGGEPGDRLLMSFHGIPKAYADQGDPYPDQCRETAALLAAELGIDSDGYIATFQSRFGPAEWVQPYTDKTLEKLAQEGCKRVDVISPAFSADCLETLEEMAVENRSLFEKAGGEQYRYVPALNARDAHIALLEQLAVSQLRGWLDGLIVPAERGECS